MDAEQLDRYRMLCDRMRGLAFHVRLIADEGPAIGHQLVVCRDPSVPLSKVRWAKAILALDDNLSSNCSKWEDWVFFADDTAIGRYLGTAGPSDLEDVPSVLERGFDLLAEYEDFDDLPEELVWDTPPVYRNGSQLPKHEYLLDLICRETGERLASPEGFDDLEVIDNHDLLQAIADQFESWVGDRTWVGDPTWLKPGQKPKSEEFTCQFQRIGKLWHVGYEVNKGNEAVPVPHRIGFNRITLLLKNPGREFTPLEVIGSKKRPDAKIKIATPEAIQNIKNRISVLQAERDGLRALTDSPEAVDRLDEIEKELHDSETHLSKMTYRGHTKFYKSDSDKARDTVRKSIEEAIESFPEQARELAKLLESDLQFGNGRWCYRPSRPTKWLF